MADQRARFQTSDSVELDGNGYGYIRFTPHGESWEVDNISVSVDTTFTDATCRIYQGQIAPQFKVDETFSGSTGDSTDTVFHLTDGESLYVEWTDGDNGGPPVATAVVRGWKTLPGRGFRAV
jgi:hypothetical protein